MKLRFLILFCTVCLLPATGCTMKQEANYDMITLVEAGGKVTLDGAPLPNAVITFESPETGSFSYAQTDASGQYKLQYDSVKHGVPIGEKLVRISTTRKILGLNTSEEAGESGEEGGEKEPAKELVPEKFNKSSELKVDVTADKTTYDFDLKS